MPTIAWALTQKCFKGEEEVKATNGVEYGEEVSSFLVK